MPRFTFKKNERLCSAKAIEELYKEGKSFYTKSLKVIFLVHPENIQTPCSVVLSVPKRSFKRAVDRNLLKRRIKESYRVNKLTLYEGLIKNKVSLHLLVLYTPKEILLFDEINKNVIQALKTLLNKVANISV